MMKSRWTFISSLLAAVLLALAVGPGQAQGPTPSQPSPSQGEGRVGVQAALGTAFTYQGQLKQDGNPVNDNCDFQFSLWDAESDGTQVGTTQTKTNVSVSNGLFTTNLDFGSVFTGDARWLAVAVRCPAGSGMYTNLSPRQALTAAPYALGLRPGVNATGDISGAILALRNTAASDVFATGVYGQSDGTAGSGVYGYASAASGVAYGVKGASNSPAGTGVYGLSNTSGNGVAGQSSTGDGVRGQSSGANKSGVYGVNTGSGFGVYGSSNEGHGVVGYALATSGETHGVRGQSDSTDGRGVVGWATAASGTNIGVYGESASIAGYGVAGLASATSGINYGVYGQSDSTAGNGVRGVASAASGATHGVFGWSLSSDGRGVYGWATADSGAAYGVEGVSHSTDGRGVVGHALATSGYTYGVEGRSDSPDGVGVYGAAPAYGLYGWATATSGTATGVYGRSDSTAGLGVYGSAPGTGYAGYFAGNVHVTGNLSVGGSKAFQIDHPLDPAGRYLYHFAQEGPEVQNVYNGLVTLDANGEAVVALPAYFSALNVGPFRYQLTAIGAPMPNLYIAQEIQDNAFRIAGGAPGKKVSWEVTAVRNDPYLRAHPAPAEVDKPAGERGTYLYPEGYGQPRELGLDYQRNRDLPEQPESEPLPGGGR